MHFANTGRSATVTFVKPSQHISIESYITKRPPYLIREHRQGRIQILRHSTRYNMGNVLQQSDISCHQIFDYSSKIVEGGFSFEPRDVVTNHVKTYKNTIVFECKELA